MTCAMSCAMSCALDAVDCVAARLLDQTSCLGEVLLAVLVPALEWPPF
jgi:hypothetical protein